MYGRWEDERDGDMESADICSYRTILEKWCIALIFLLSNGMPGDVEVSGASYSESNGVFLPPVSCATHCPKENGEITLSCLTVMPKCFQMSYKFNK